MRLLLASAAFACLAGPAAAQVFAIDQRVPLKLAGFTENTATAVQIVAEGQAPTGPFDAWVWTFTRSPQLEGVARFDGTAVLTRFDCRAGTRQRLKYEFYLGEVVVNDTPHQEAAAAPVPDSLEAAALRTVCDPSFNADYRVRPIGARGLRANFEDFWNSVAAEAGSTWAMDRTAPMKPTSETDAAIGFVEVPADGRAPTAPFEAWTWTFSRQMLPGPDGPWNGAAVLTRYDCAAGTREPLRMQFYQGETLIKELEAPEAAAAPEPGSMEEFALKTACDPAFQSQMPVLREGARWVRRSVDGYFASS